MILNLRLLCSVLDSPAHGRGLHASVRGSGRQIVRGGAGPGHGGGCARRNDQGSDEECRPNPTRPHGPFLRQNEGHPALHTGQEWLVCFQWIRKQEIPLAV